ncbi:MAG: hypothetical protein KUL79_12020 [Thauera sp.]|nr:hypothetical protein [Thauera sp.]
MSNIQHRHQGEAAAHPDATKENATAGNRGAADRANQTDQHSTRETSRETERERGEYLPLAWAQLGREVKPQKFKGKGKRQARAAAIRAKRNQGGAALFDALAWVAFGAWLATVALWLAEVLS